MLANEIFSIGLFLTFKGNYETIFFTLICPNQLYM
jgi:hypothetical protein